MATLRSWVSSLPNQFAMLNSAVSRRSTVVPSSVIKASSGDLVMNDKDFSKRRLILVGVGAVAASLFPARFASAEEVPKGYQAFVDFTDGYSYVYPSDWRDFDFTGHDSAFKDRFAALQHVRVSFIPTDKNDVHDLGPMEEWDLAGFPIGIGPVSLQEEKKTSMVLVLPKQALKLFSSKGCSLVIFDLVRNVYAAPTQIPTIYDMQERTINGKNYWTFEYELASSSFSRTAFATIAIGNGRYYTLVVGANERRWSRLRDKLKVVADSLKILDI